MTAVRLELLLDPSLPNKGPGRAADGDTFVSEFRATVAPKSDPKKTRKVVFKRAEADYAQVRFEVEKAIDGDRKTGWAIGTDPGKPHTVPML